ncbi:hypothetical protein HME9302_01460 [Alteripontixanthobacter maritimus]|uniref:Uncharacterized protein n=1 Tax=Alteripontixanthobacter maritimus TaxID=2161824 RepID=A0A369QBG9_9SPHN|nr:hypothetical protein [Alteripontixanthobacter maritimus]RDC60259.1 hypothetical protein HME9302_01460 [Alteripontixanthobacter maritimus]
MKILSKALVGTAVAGAMTVAAASPAAARDRYERDDGISAGEVIAGAVILGGIAAVLSSGRDRDRGYYDDRNRYRDRYNRGYSRQSYGRRAVEKCIRAAEGDARRYGYRYADVTQIRDVDRKRNGFRVRGTIRVDGNRGGYRNDRYGRYDRYDRRNRYNRRSDTGRFTCDIRRGRVVDLDFKGVRGLR